MDKLFGTDGIRGVAGEFPLDEKTVAVIGASFAKQLREELGREPRLVSGRDTRESGKWIETAFHSGAASVGAVCESAGVITTPGVAYTTGAFEFDAGVVISASHNPYQDNGIKIFLPTGKKLGPDYERKIEADIYAKKGTAFELVQLDTSRAGEFHGAYVGHLLEIGGGFSASEKRIVIDCANGAACAFAGELFERLGAEVVTIHSSPDGRNINEACGSTDLEHLVRDGRFAESRLRNTVLEHSADLGIAFDGDADRVLFVDEHGNFVDGDATLWVMARYLKTHRKLANSTVVATVMSNIGLEIALAGESIKLLRTDVGDKYVLDELLKTGSEIGGEQSGHIIFPEVSLVGDGMMTAIRVLKAITEKAVSLSQAAAGFTRFPQTLLNVVVKEKRPFDDVPQIVTAATEIDRELHGEGRLLLRYSGTQNLARIMIEGKDQAAIEGQARRLADVIESALN
ncbi:MAG TPA: phosphoglucosamine mutase [Pyrinomonadaceae bacterium]|jgi:phosphoglucosamine mutase|nr:phosphoglucosamine mutase [Pyrinomonadaceae bacterium]